MSGYSLDSFWEYDRYTPESMQRVLKVEQAQQRAESANFFTRSALTNEFEAKYGRSDVPERTDVDWLSTDGEYARRAGVADEAQKRVEAAESEVGSLESKATTATDTRQCAYTDYVAKHESHEESRVIKPSMTEAKAHEVSERQMKRDQRYLAAGSSPAQARESLAAEKALIQRKSQTVAQKKSATSVTPCGAFARNPSAKYEKTIKGELSQNSDESVVRFSTE